MTLENALHTFIAESRELLEEMETALLEIDGAGTDPEIINAIFRAAHTIKGSAGLFSLDHVVAFTHVAESVLESVRSGALALDDDLIALMLACRDHVGDLLDVVDGGRIDEDPEVTAAGMPLLARLQAYLAPAAATGTAAAAPVLAPAALTLHAEALTGTVERLSGERGGVDTWHISLRFGSDVMRNGMDPMSFLRYLGTLGTVVHIVTLHDAVPVLDALDVEACYLGFEIAFASTADKTAIESVFEFVRDDCRIRIVAPHSRIEEYVRLIHESPEDVARLGDILVRSGAVTAHELELALRTQAQMHSTYDFDTGSRPGSKAGPHTVHPLGEILIAQGAAPAPAVEAALVRQGRGRDAKSSESGSIRIDADKLDRLINLVGELIITTASASLIARRSKNTELQECSSTLSTLVEEVRDSTLQLRMVRIGATFNRFQRVVHDVSRELGKDIALDVSGEDTELDKTVVEKITDPLTHLVRNAIDHGIEAPALRAERGKPPTGRIRLNAFHDSGTIVIEVSDDGGGLKRERILAKALERGLVEPGRQLSDEEIYGLIFEPGFSTAEQVTNLSGRGVGMDVVKRNITALRGTVGVGSREGAGTTVTVRLPLTLAIINGFLVEIGRSMFVIPLDMIEECIAFSSQGGHDYTSLRGHVLPFVRLREFFGVGGEPVRRENIVVVRHGGQSAGLVVDTLLGEFQTVIKPLNKMFQHVRCISGSTILGSGQVALILDVPALISQVCQAARAGAGGECAPVTAGIAA